MRKVEITEAEVCKLRLFWVAVLAFSSWHYTLIKEATILFIPLDLCCGANLEEEKKINGKLEQIRTSN